MKNLRLIFDSNNTAYRANCVTELYTKLGQRTSAIIGVLNIIHSVVGDLEKSLQTPVAEIIFAWDKGHSARRKALFPEYKANRKHEKTEEEQIWMQEFIEQANILYENLPIFGVKCLRKPGFEGDDLVYGLVEALQCKHPEDIVVIISTDEDFHQLIGKNVCVYSPIKQILFTLENYEELIGIPQELFLTYKILKGDASDGIPGIPGIGDKTAKALVKNYGSLDKILSPNYRAELCKSKRTQKIFTAEGLQTLSRNNQLINLKDYVDLTEVSEEIQSLINTPPCLDKKAATEFLKRFQLVSILMKWHSWIQVFEDCVSHYLEGDKY